MGWLEKAEEKLLNYSGILDVRHRVAKRFVPVAGGLAQLWSVSVSPDNAQKSSNVPIVLLHGFGAGVGLWVGNFDAFAENRAVHAMDLLGFGRSSRPKFSQDATLAELEWVNSIEDWREGMNLDSFILMGHSLGGFLAASYAIEHPRHVRHLILVDPWGFPTRPPDSADRQITLPAWVRAVGSVLQHFNPLASLRAAGPWGPQLVKRIRPDLGYRFAGIIEPDQLYDYIYHCNAQKPSGEAAFKSIQIPFGWAKRPMRDRLTQLDPRVPITFVYGSRSWIDHGPGYDVMHDIRRDSYVDVQVIHGAGHHVYIDRIEDFNAKINEICDIVDSNQDGVSFAIGHHHPLSHPVK